MQWFKNSVAIDGANSAIMVMTDLQATDIGTYTVEAAHGPAGDFAPNGFNIAGPTVTGLTAITWNGQKFVAVGEFGLILVSPDGSQR